MAYKVRHKGKQKRSGLAPGLGPVVVQVLVILAVFIVAVLLPHPGEGKTDIVSVVALVVTGAGVVLAGVTWAVQALLGRRRARGERVSAVVTFLYRVSFVLIMSGLVAAFYRTMFGRPPEHTLR